jgi:hypothetical protein
MHIGTQLAFEHITLVRFGLALYAIFQVDRPLFPRHLPCNHIKAGCFLADGCVLNCLPNKKLERHRIPFPLGHSYRATAATVFKAMTPIGKTMPANADIGSIFFRYSAAPVF